MSFKVKFVMFSILNIMMAAAMSLTADIINQSLSLRTLLMVLVGYVVGMTLSFLIPWNKVSGFICGLFHLKNKFLCILVGSIVPSFVNTAIISFVMVFINVNPFKLGWNITFGAYFSTFWIMQLVAYIVSCFANPISGLVASKMIEGGKKE